MLIPSNLRQPSRFKLLCQHARSFSSSRSLNADVTHIVIGAGVVGLAVARQLARREGTSTLVVERHGTIGMETSSRNSEVIHAGLYYPPTSLKTQLCIEGKQMLYDLCSAQSIPHKTTKKWIIAQNESQWSACLKLHEHACNIGVPTRFIAPQEAKQREPGVCARAGILESPTTGIVDSHALMTYLQADFEDRGGDVALHTTVNRIKVLDGGKGGYKLYTNPTDRASTVEGEEDSITAETIINCAGNFACEINNMVLPPSRHRTAYFAKGNYFSYASSHPKPSTLLYPAPQAGLGGLGTHLTLDMAGRVRFGPDVEWVDDPNDLKPNPAHLNLAISAIQEYLPAIDTGAIDLDYCGIRPKLAPAAPSTGLSSFQDFIIQKEEGVEGFVNLLGIESPGLTSSLAIAEMVDGLLYK
ncbi:hypothetical protein AJ80_08642 [Polytolypa hystricis UAMH7299]|uniref:L-2-hydroxyglutarate dehydrogenase, mitochondrial n=1 Tax=Polytolypa hystricis (strain UAMH7299) TaxID=1447883 RepID=A0A2B7X4W3_POLH7|nr:hypothetical protein AJ80_08642 [Polytolypa hystricis UAMH7299]